jgi:hypothetical protein
VTGMTIPKKDIAWQVGSWQVGLTLCLGDLSLGVWWDGDPISFALSLPFITLWVEREGGRYWQWDWTMLRVVVGKQEFRADLTLNNWSLGIAMSQTDDWSIHLGPLDIECEYDKFYDDDLYTKPAADLRLFSKARQPCECELEHAHTPSRSSDDHRFNALRPDQLPASGDDGLVRRSL